MLIGDVIRCTSVKAHFANSDLKWATYNIPDKSKIGVFLFLGVESKDGSTSLDLERAMNNLGWFREKPKRVKK